MHRVSTTGLVIGLFLMGFGAGTGCTDDETWTPPPEMFEYTGGIVGGTPTSGWPAVGAYIINGGYGGMCTATLVTPDILLTAAHCVEYSGNDDMFYVGDNVNNASWNDLWDIDQAIAHPNYNAYSDHPHDIALLFLNQPLFGVDPIPVNTTPFQQSWIGDWFHYVGFGVDDYYGGNNAGIKRETDVELYDYGNTEYIHYTPGTNTCSGDSGGPSLREIGGQWYVAGVNSAVFSIQGNEDACHGAGWEMRVDGELNWLDDYFDPYAGDDDAGDDDAGDDDAGDDDAGDDDAGDDDAGDDDAGDDDAGDDDAGDDDAGDDDENDDDETFLVGPENDCSCSVDGRAAGAAPLALLALGALIAHRTRRRRDQRVD